MEDNLLALTADIVSAHVGNNKIAAAEVADLIARTYSALSAVANPSEPHAVKAEPAVSIRSSIRHDYIVCLEDGAKLKMLKRYLATNYAMTPDEYRAKWGLSKDYPMVAPAYAEHRRTLAKAVGLGRRAASKVLADPAAVLPKVPKPPISEATKLEENAGADAPIKRGRSAKAKAEEAPPSEASQE